MPTGIYKRNNFGERHPNWKGGKPHCKDCGILLSSYSYGRCRKCSIKFRIGENSAHWKGGIPKCIDCGKELTARIKRTKKIRCRECINKFKKGKNHPNWQGGLTPFHQFLRNHNLMNEWREEIFKRDNYTCKECGDNKGGNLNAHHNIKSFNLILKEFLQKYNEFSIFDDREILIKLAERYEPFWDIDNGITLCEKCHNKIKVEV